MYESWVLHEVVPFIQSGLRWRARGDDLRRRSLGAYHAANFALKRADVFPLAICMSGSYDPSHWDSWGERGDATYFNSTRWDYVHGHLDGDHLEWLPATR